MRCNGDFIQQQPRQPTAGASAEARLAHRTPVGGRPDPFSLGWKVMRPRGG